MNGIPPGPIKFVRVPMSDVEAAKRVEPPRLATSEQSRKFAVMGAAILEKLCRSGNLEVRARRTSPYVLNTVRGNTAVSVIVSAVNGDLHSKHMLVPLSSLGKPPGTVRHVFVCAFVSKLERVREKNGGINTMLAGWATDREILASAERTPRIATGIEVAAVPVSALHPIQTLRYYLSPKQKGEQKCESSLQPQSSPAQPPLGAAATAKSSTPTMRSTEPSSDGPTAP